MGITYNSTPTFKETILFLYITVVCIEIQNGTLHLNSKVH